MLEPIKKMRCRAELGEWYYQRVIDDYKMSAPFYHLLDAEQNHVDDFDSYAEMRSYIEKVKGE